MKKLLRARIHIFILYFLILILLLIINWQYIRLDKIKTENQQLKEITK